MSVNKKNSDGSYNQYASKPYVTKDNIGLSKVENKSSEDIRGEITSKNVTDALGYTPVNPNPQFIYDNDEKMTKVVPENVNKGVVAMIGGKTQKMIQMVNGLSSDIISPGITVAYNNGTVSLSGKATVDINTPLTNPISFVSGHKTLIKGAKRITSSNRGSICISAQVVGSVMFCKDDTVITPVTTIESPLRLVLYKDDVVTASSDSFVPMVFDLTAMFGAGNEPTVEQFNTMFGTGFIPYTESSLWNAPVRKVALKIPDTRTLNRISTANINSNGNISELSNNDVITYPVKMGETYLFDKGEDNAVYAFYNALPIKGSVSYNKSRTVSDQTGLVEVVAPINGYLAFRTAKGYSAKVYNKTTLLLDKIVDKLPDYGCSAGDVYNYVDFEEMVYHHKVGSVDLANVTFNAYNETYAWAMITSDVTRINIKKVSQTTSEANVVSEKYTTTYISGNHHMTIPNSLAVGSAGQIFCNNGSTTEMPSGVINYELETEKLIEISDILVPFMLESGGTITFENEHNLDVPNTVIYEKEMK